MHLSFEPVKAEVHGNPAARTRARGEGMCRARGCWETLVVLFAVGDWLDNGLVPPFFWMRMMRPRVGEHGVYIDFLLGTC